MAFRIKGYDHVGIRVSDRARALEFYGRLGFQEVEELSTDRVAEIVSADGARINLIFNGEARPGAANILMDEPDKWPGCTHAAFILDRLQPLLDWAGEEGVAITEGPHDWGRRHTCFLRDPDGNVLEFNELVGKAADAANPADRAPLVLHEYWRSGNCYKIRLTAAHLGLALERREYDIIGGETRTPAFLAEVNANGRVPVLQVGDHYLPESNAACFYLATGSDLIPHDPFRAAEMLQWMFFEQYSHEPNIASLRFWRAYIGEERLTEARRALIPAKLAAGNAALKVMDDRLAEREFMVDERFGLADIALYAYTHAAEEGGFALDSFPNVRRWLERIAAQPGHVPIDAA